MGMPVDPVWGQEDYAFYEDGTESGATLIGSAGAQQTLEVDTVYHCRLAIGDTAGTNQPSLNLTCLWQFDIDGGGWTTVTGSTAVQFVDNANLTDGGTTTNRQPTGTGAFNAGRVYETANTSAVVYTLPGDDSTSHTEVVLHFQIDSAQVSDGNTILIRCVHGDTTAFTNYTHASIDVNVAAPVNITCTQGNVNLSSVLPVVAVTERVSIAVGQESLLLSSTTFTVEIAAPVNIPISHYDFSIPLALGHFVEEDGPFLTYGKELVDVLNSFGAKISPPNIRLPPGAQLLVTGYAPEPVKSSPPIIPLAAQLLLGKEPSVEDEPFPFATFGNEVLTDALLTGFTVAITDRVNVYPGQDGLSLSSVAPTLTFTNNVAPYVPAESLLLSKYAPGLTFTNNVAPASPAGTVLLDSVAPGLTFTENVLRSPAHDDLLLTGNIPVVDAGTNVTVTCVQGNVNLSSVLPVVTVTANVPIAVGPDDLQIAGAVPVVSADANVNIGIAQDNLLVSSVVPVVSVTENVPIAVGPDALQLSSVVPVVDVTANVSIAVGQDALLLSSVVPVVDVTANVPISVGQAALQLSSVAPVVDTAANVFISVGQDALLLSSVLPTVSVTLNVPIAVSPGDLVIDAIAPVVDTGGADIGITVNQSNLVVTGYSFSHTGGSAPTTTWTPINDSTDTWTAIPDKVSNWS